MITYIINKSDLTILRVYDKDTPPELVFYYKEPYASHVDVPEGIDVSCIKVTLVDDVITLTEDSILVAAKAQSAKDAQVAELKAACNADIEAKQIEVYGTANQSAALATQQSWSDIESYTQEYVPLMFPTLDAANEYIVPKMLAARQFAAWRFNRIAQRDAAIAAL